MRRIPLVVALALIGLAIVSAPPSVAGSLAPVDPPSSNAATETPSIPWPPTAIVIDGRFEDWQATEPVWSDPAEDGTGDGIDLGRLWVTSDIERVFLCFETGTEMGLQGGNDMTLLIDGDDDTSTGTGRFGMGVDLVWRFGQREGAVYTGGDDTRRRIEQSDMGLRQGPTVSSTVFEISLLRSALPPGDAIRICITTGSRTGSDRLPDADGGVRVALSDATPGVTDPRTLDREHADDLRVMTYNVLFDGLFKRPAPFIRILRAVDPDVVCFQEIWSHTAQQAVDQVNLALPGGAPWYGGSTEDGLIVSRYPIIEDRSVDEAGNHWALIDLPDETYGADLSLISAHPPCCDNEEGRQEELDGIAAWMRDLKLGGSPGIATGTFIVIAGDMNLVGLSGQVETLVAGTISDEERFGRTVAADWDGTPMSDASPLHIGGREGYTWRDDTSSFAPGKLDYIVYSDSVMEMTGGFVLRTEDLPGEILESYGLRAADTGEASDHLPVVADFRRR